MHVSTTKNSNIINTTTLQPIGTVLGQHHREEYMQGENGKPGTASIYCVFWWMKKIETFLPSATWCIALECPSPDQLRNTWSLTPQRHSIRSIQLNAHFVAYDNRPPHQCVFNHKVRASTAIRVVITHNTVMLW